MKSYFFILALVLPLLSGAASADNIAACEAVLMEPILDEGVETGATMASFRPATDFLSSVYDDKDSHLKEIDGHEIRGIMCTRRNVVPTLRDFPIVATGLSLAISENFDSPESNLLTVYYADGQFQYKYDGRPLSSEAQAKLADVMDIFNLQPHDLDKGKGMERSFKDKQEAVK